MKTFNVHKHAVLGYEAVKQGWSWPAFFFSFIWSGTKGLWVNAAMFLLFTFILISVESTMLAGSFQGEDNSAGIMVVNVLFLALYVYWGANGNKWRREALSKKGYEFVESVQAPTPEAAIGAVVKGKDDQAMVQASTG